MTDKPTEYKPKSGHIGLCFECRQDFHRKRYRYLWDDGRPNNPEYCSGKCRQKSYRKRKKEARRAARLAALEEERNATLRESVTAGDRQKRNATGLRSKRNVVVDRSVTSPAGGARNGRPCRKALRKQPGVKRNAKRGAKK